MEKTISQPKIFPPTLLFLAMMLMSGLHFLFPFAQVLLIWGRLIGLLPLVVGISINILADNQFKRANTTVRPFEESDWLVTTGLYHYSRNPMYLGMVLILFGVALLLGSLTPFGVLLLFFGYVDLQFVRREEQMLATQFGQDWLEYKARVRRWI